jgi:ABC-type Fe3+ transport system permease subunit
MLALAVGLYTQLGTLGLGLAPAVVLLLATIPLFLLGGLAIRRISGASAAGHTDYPFALAQPSLAFYCAFFLVPLAYLLLFAVATTVGFGEVVYGFDLSNFETALGTIYIEVFLRTLRTAAIGTLLIVLVGYPLAYWIARYAPPNRRGLFLALIIVPFWTSFLIRTYSFLIVLSPEFFVSDWLQSLGLTNGPLEILYTTTAVQIGLVYNYLPLFVLPLYATLERMDWRLVDAGGLPPDHPAADGAGARDGHAARLHPHDGRVHHPAGARRRTRRPDRQRDPARVPRAAGLRLRSRSRRARDGRAVGVRRALPVPQRAHRAGIRWLKRDASWAHS